MNHEEGGHSIESNKIFRGLKAEDKHIKGMIEKVYETGGG